MTFNHLHHFRSKNGSIMFPELSHNADFTTSVEASRRKSERNYMGLQLELAEGAFVSSPLTFTNPDYVVFRQLIPPVSFRAR